MFYPPKLSSNITSVSHDPLTRIPEPYMHSKIPSHPKSTNDDPIQWNSARFFLINQMANQTAGVINRVHPLHSSGAQSVPLVPKPLFKSAMSDLERNIWSLRINYSNMVKLKLFVQNSCKKTSGTFCCMSLIMEEK